VLHGLRRFAARAFRWSSFRRKAEEAARQREPFLSSGSRTLMSNLSKLPGLGRRGGGGRGWPRIFPFTRFAFLAHPRQMRRLCSHSLSFLLKPFLLSDGITATCFPSLRPFVRTITWIDTTQISLQSASSLSRLEAHRVHTTKSALKHAYVSPEFWRSSDSAVTPLMAGRRRTTVN